MGYRCVVTAPGQGVQRPGMLDPWLDSSPEAPEMVGEWSDAAGFDLVAAGRDETLLADTAFAQPLIVATSVLAYRLLCSTCPLHAGEVLFAGHSVGELAAAVGARYLAPSAAVALAAVRGRAMSKACAFARTGMAAVMPTKRAGASDEEIGAAVAAAGLTVANRNGSHQFVAAGPVDRIKALSDEPPAGMRVAPLSVAGAFHTEYMAPAVERFAREMQTAEVTAPVSVMLGNGDGGPMMGPEDLRRRLITQLTSSVRWDLCAQTIARAAPESLHIELAPAGPLTRLLQRSRPEARAVALRGPEDIARVADELSAVGDSAEAPSTAAV